MAFCRHCGREVPDEAVICVGCGCAMDNVPSTKKMSEEIGVSAGWFWLGFFFMVVGLILYLIWKEDRPIRARKCGKGALVGLIVSLIFNGLWYAYILSHAPYYAFLPLAFLL